MKHLPSHMNEIKRLRRATEIPSLSVLAPKLRRTPLQIRREKLELPADRDGLRRKAFAIVACLNSQFRRDHHAITCRQTDVPKLLVE